MSRSAVHRLDKATSALLQFSLKTHGRESKGEMETFSGALFSCGLQHITRKNAETFLSLVEKDLIYFFASWSKRSIP